MSLPYVVRNNYIASLGIYLVLSMALNDTVDLTEPPWTWPKAVRGNMMRLKHAAV